MQLTRARSRLLTTVIAWVMLFAAWAPGISQAWMLQRAQNAAWVELCTAQGSKWIQVAGARSVVLSTAAFDQNPDDAESGIHIQHCPICITDLGYGLLPTSSHLRLTQTVPTLQPAFLSHAPRAILWWTTAQSRAPPTTLS